MNDFLSGALVTGYAVAGLFFLRFWKQSRDRLFALFALAFWVLAFQRLALSLSLPSRLFHSEERAEGHIAFYVLRLLAFVLILIAILDKNRARRT
jgi:hypothetical protein